MIHTMNFKNDNLTYWEGKKVLVTGAAGGIGKAIVKNLSKRNAIVYATDLSLQTLKELSQLPGVYTFSLDVTKLSSWKSLLQKIQVSAPNSLDRKTNNFKNKKSKPNKDSTHSSIVNPTQNILDGLIQCAGVLRPNYVKNIPPEDIDYHIDINVKGLMLGTIMCLKIFQEQESGGHIVNIASLAGLAPIPGLSLYSSSKFAVRAFTLALAEELKNTKISATVVCPDAVKTPMLDIQVGKEEAALTFSGKQLEPDEVAEAVLESFYTKKREIILPLYRGILGKLGNDFPTIASYIASILKKKGMKKQEEYKKINKEKNYAKK